MTKAKYKNLAELKLAIDNKEIDSTAVNLTIDNDSVYAYSEVYNAEEDEVESDELLFRGGMPTDVLKEALDLLGIPSDFA